MSTDNARYKCVLARPWLLLAELIVSSGAVRVELVGVLLGCGSHSCERQRGLVRPLFAKSAHSSSLPPSRRSSHDKGRAGGEQPRQASPGKVLRKLGTRGPSHAQSALFAHRNKSIILDCRPGAEAHQGGLSVDFEAL